ncbi:FGGY-family carbohydrate kinase [Gemmobacter aquatilis]|nr:FGGY-family carbohydrate kinase [Gemmobacter aquatilis]
MTHIAVIDIGKTNAKLALVDAETLAERAVITRPNSVLPGPPWPHFDLDGHWQFLLSGLAQFHRDYGIAAISVTTHGAAAVFLDAAGGLAAPMLDYEHPGPDAMAAAYDALRPDFAETGSPRLAMGLNLGAQLYWQLATDPGLRARTHAIVTYPQYWGFLLTGELASDVSSLGCHSDLWNPWQGQFSTLVEKLGLAGVLAPARLPGARLGGLLHKVAAQTGIPAGTPVSVGIHDSNASIYPYLRARTGPFAVVSTGTWVVSMAVGAETTLLDATRDVLVNVSALGQPVPSARFMGGREFEIIAAGLGNSILPEDRAQVLAAGLALLPAVEPASGPFAGRQMAWTAQPRTSGQKRVALSWYLALMTDTCLSLIGARGPVIVEGPFARNSDYLDMLASLRPEGVETAASTTGTAIGAALLMLRTAAPHATLRYGPEIDGPRYLQYARRWHSLLAR